MPDKDFGNLRRASQPVHNSFLEAGSWKVFARKAAQMTSSVFIYIGVVAAVPLLILLAKVCKPKPAKATKGEKAAIMRQLLALSERENGVSPGSRRRPTNVRRSVATLTPKAPLRKYVPQGGGPIRAVPLKSNLNEAETEAQIRQRAHELYQERGGVNGSATDDWNRAREEVLRRKAKAATT